MNENNNTPKDVFSYLLAIVTLYISVVSFIALMFQYVNVLFPDKLNFYFTSASDIIRQSAAAIIIAWPVYIFMSWLLGKDMKRVPEKREIGIRKWLLYLTLFIAAITIIIDLITLTHSFFSGELTVTFFLKTFSILTVASGVFGYYIWDLRRAVQNMSDLPKVLAWVVSAIILISVIAGFFIAGSPATQRARRFDERRISDLTSLQYQIINYWQQKKELPENLRDLQSDFQGYTPLQDPQNNHQYIYNLKGDLTFELCAIFSTSNKDLVKIEAGYYYDENWVHEKGEVCFERTIDPELYKPNNINPAKPLFAPQEYYR